MINLHDIRYARLGTQDLDSAIKFAASIVGLVWYPMRFTPFAVLLALIAAAMSPKNARLPLAAVAFGAICFVVGLTIAVATDNPIY